MDVNEPIKKYNGRAFCCACQGLCGEIADFEVQGYHFCHYHVAEMFKDYIDKFGHDIPVEFVEEFVIKPQI
nr:hypothetical protein [Candidatus Sigynarchaeota archaeon]